MKLNKKILSICISIILITASFPPNAPGITIKEEEELSKEFMKVVLNHFALIKDPLILNYVNQISSKILSALPPQPFAYHIHVIKEDTYNAFATPAGHIFINSGLIEAMDSEEELAGIISHEAAHVLCRHISKQIERSSKIGLATLAGIAAGIFLGMAGASSEAINAVSIGSMAAGQSFSLAYTREDEKQADQIGLKHLTQAGYTGTGLIKILKKIRDKRWFDENDIPTYITTHPAIEDRIAYIDTWLETEGKKHTETSRQQTTDNKFQEAHDRIVALYGDERAALTYFKAKLVKTPNDPAAHHGYGLILARTDNRKDAIPHLKAALEKKAFDPYILKDLGKTYFLDGNYSESLKTLTGSASINSDDPETLFYLGMTQMELNNLDKAVSAFENLMKKAPEYKEALYYLGEAYGRQGNMEEAHYHLGVYYKEKQDFKTAVFHLNKASDITKDTDRKNKIEEMLKDILKQREKLKTN